MSYPQQKLKVEVAQAFKPLLKPSRYKAAYGGRGGAKSHFFAEQVVLRAFSKPSRIVCIREVQNSIKDSVKQLIEDKINKFSLGPFFKITEQQIEGKNGSLILFKGMQKYNAQNIKSLEDIDVAWVEEAQTLSSLSLRMLRPTIRANNSELWFSWNPMSKYDAVDQLFRGKNPPKNSIIIPVSWKDNPWLPDVLREELLEDYENDSDVADHVWGGGYEIVAQGAYYARAILGLERAGCIRAVRYDPNYPVYTAWDLGIDDCTAVWFAQIIGNEVRIIDHFETRNKGLLEIVAEDIKPKGYVYAEHYMPHDINTRELSTGLTRKEQLENMGFHDIVPGSQIPVVDGINAARNMLRKCVFDREKCQLGLDALQSYRTEEDDEKKTNKPKPRHDWASHSADAFRELAVNLFDTSKLSKRERTIIEYDPLTGNSTDGHGVYSAEQVHSGFMQDYDPMRADGGYDPFNN